MRTTAEILRSVVDFNWYGSGAHRSKYMCVALLHAAYKGVVSLDECVQCTADIEKSF